MRRMRVSELRIANHRNRSHLSGVSERDLRRIETREYPLSTESISDSEDREFIHLEINFHRFFCVGVSFFLEKVAKEVREREREIEKERLISFERRRNTRHREVCAIARRVISSTGTKSGGTEERERKRTQSRAIDNRRQRDTISANLKNEFALSRAPGRREKRR